jgi:predicted DNA-binding transcriptional regulator AlpA
MSFSTTPAAEAASPGKRRRRNPAPEYRPDDPLVTAREAAVETGKGLSTLWRDVRAGLLPAPYYVSPRCPRWRLSELRAAVEATRRRKLPTN